MTTRTFDDFIKLMLHNAGLAKRNAATLESSLRKIRENPAKLDGETVDLLHTLLDALGGTALDLGVALGAAQFVALEAKHHA